MLNRPCRKWRFGVRSCIFTLFVMSLVLCVTPAQAGISTVSFEVNASSSLGSGTYQITMGLTNHNPATDTWWWTLASPLDIMDGLNTIATLDAASFIYIGDPQVDFDFTITAGAADVEITVSSALLSFTTINSASGFASASLDFIDDGLGAATLTGLGPGGVVIRQPHRDLIRS